MATQLSTTKAASGAYPLLDRTSVYDHRRPKSAARFLTALAKYRPFASTGRAFSHRASCKFACGSPTSLDSGQIVSIESRMGRLRPSRRWWPALRHADGGFDASITLYLAGRSTRTEASQYVAVTSAVPSRSGAQAAVLHFTHIAEVGAIVFQPCPSIDPPGLEII